MKCANCGEFFKGYGHFYGDKCGFNHLCQQCSERKIMPNIKITAEVDGKQVPLETVSTETFEAIKALEKPEIPVARTGKIYTNNKRLILRTNDYLRKFIAEHDFPVIAIDLETGVVMHWGDMHIYRDIRSL